ncbi:MAG: DegT/DnrJ/EryC1/StrS family aminotransferase [Alphaproteobacteria bacterium]|nr:DegT/DnrJ/EryC1/StrS family aminotransferase [Alphaproteobacteria bacterium]
MPLNLGRSALRLVLDAQRRLTPQRRLVLLPDYVCPSVVSTVRLAGLEPVPVPVAADDLNMLPEAVSSMISHETLAVIAVSMYGVPVPMEEIAASCRRSGAILVDDAAHAVGIRRGDLLLGCGGDAGLLSFNQSKTITGGSIEGGGLLIINNPALQKEIFDNLYRMARAAGRPGEVLSFVLNHLCDRFAYPPEVYTGQLRRRFGLPVPARPEIGPALISNAAASAVLAQLPRLPAILDGRIRIAGWYGELLPRIEELEFPQGRPGRYLSRILIRLPPGTEAKALQDALRTHGVRTRLGYPDWARQWKPKAPELIELPMRLAMSKPDVAKVCGALAKELTRLARGQRQSDGRAWGAVDEER